jgi:hypothetical protein
MPRTQPMSARASRKIISGEYDCSGKNHVGTAALGCSAERSSAVLVAEKIQD